MNDPKLASKRVSVVQSVKADGVPKDEAYAEAQRRGKKQTGYRFEGHMLNQTIDRVYDDA